MPVNLSFCSGHGHNGAEWNEGKWSESLPRDHKDALGKVSHCFQVFSKGVGVPLKMSTRHLVTKWHPQVHRSFYFIFSEPVFNNSLVSQLLGPHFEFLCGPTLIFLQMSVLFGCISKTVSVLGTAGLPILFFYFQVKKLKCFREMLKDKHLAISPAEDWELQFSFSVYRPTASVLMGNVLLYNV